MRLLLVEENKNMARVIKSGLKMEQYAVDLALNGEEGLYFAENCPYDLILLNRSLTNIDGLEILQKIRQKKIKTPIIMLSGINSVAERIEGLRQGADDYIVKPFIFEELLARIQNLIRRYHGMATNLIIVNDLTVNLDNHSVILSSQANSD